MPETQEQAKAADVTLDQVGTLVANDITLVKQAAALIAKKDFLGLAKLAYENKALVEQQVNDVEQAIPAFKAGYKTTEFWLVLIYIGVVVYFVAIGHPLAFSADITLGSVVTAYLGSRHLIKTKSN